MGTGMGLGMGFFWLVPVLVIGLLAWFLLSLTKNSSNKQQK